MAQATMKRQEHMPLQKCINGESVRNLSDMELLSIVIGSGVKNIDVFDLSIQILKQHHGIAGLVYTGLRELAQITGLGVRKAIRIHAALEMGRRSLKQKDNKVCVNTPRAVWELLMPHMACLEKEEFIVLALNNQNYVIKREQISIGTLNEAIVHPREVFRNAIREGASSVIIAHNHPSGNLKPSKEDIATTRRLFKAGEIIGIALLDHIIITHSSYLSLKECGYL